MLRAGFTDVFVTGMLIRWISVSPRPIAIGAKPAGARLSVAPRMMIRKNEGHHDLGDERRDQRVAARRVLAVAVARRSRRTSIEARRLPLAMTYSDAARRRSRRGPARRCRAASSRAESGRRPEADRDGRIEVAAGDVADRVRHRQDGQAERERDAEQADADARETRPRAPRCRSLRAPARTCRGTPPPYFFIARPSWTGAHFPPRHMVPPYRACGESNFGSMSGERACCRKEAISQPDEVRVRIMENRATCRPASRP